MMTSFIEWAKIKEQQLEEAVRPRNPDLEAEPKLHDVIIFNPQDVVPKLDPTNPLMPGDKTMQMGFVNKAEGEYIKVVPMGQSAEEPYNIRAKSAYFRDITDGIDTSLSDGPQSSFLLYVGTDRSYDDVLSTKLPRPGAGDLDVLNMSQHLGGEKEVKRRINQAANTERDGWLQKMELQAQKGMDVTNAFRDEMNQFDGRKLQHFAPTVVQQLHDKGIEIPGIQAPLAASRQDTPAEPDHLRIEPQQAAAVGQARDGLDRTPEQMRAAQKFAGLRLAHFSGLNRWKMFRETTRYKKYPTS